MKGGGGTIYKALVKINLGEEKKVCDHCVSGPFTRPYRLGLCQLWAAITLDETWDEFNRN